MTFKLIRATMKWALFVEFALVTNPFSAATTRNNNAVNRSGQADLK